MHFLRKKCKVGQDFAYFWFVYLYVIRIDRIDGIDMTDVNSDI